LITTIHAGSTASPVHNATLERLHFRAYQEAHKSCLIILGKMPILPSFWHIALDCKHAQFFGGYHWLVVVEVYSSSLQVATAGALLEIVLKNLISAHDTVDFLAPLALALMCQPSTDQVGLLASPSTSCCCLLALGTKAHCLLSGSTKQTKAHVSSFSAAEKMISRDVDMCLGSRLFKPLICAGLTVVAACCFHLFHLSAEMHNAYLWLVKGAGLLGTTDVDYNAQHGP